MPASLGPTFSPRARRESSAEVMAGGISVAASSIRAMLPQSSAGAWPASATSWATPVRLPLSRAERLSIRLQPDDATRQQAHAQGRDRYSKNAIERRGTKLQPRFL